jgi:hypothetical protein
MGRRKASQPAPSAPSAPSAPTVSVWTEGVTEPVQLCFNNTADCRVDINWLDYDGNQQKYSTLKPKGSYALSRFLGPGGGHSAAAAVHLENVPDPLTEAVTLLITLESSMLVLLPCVLVDSALLSDHSALPCRALYPGSYSTHAWVVSYEDGHSATYVGKQTAIRAHKT